MTYALLLIGLLATNKNLILKRTPCFFSFYAKISGKLKNTVSLAQNSNYIEF